MGLRVGGRRPRVPVGEVAFRARGGRRPRAVDAVVPDGAGAVGSVDRDRGDAGQGGADRRPPSGRVPRQHASHGGGDQGTRRGGAMTLAIGVTVTGLDEGTVDFVRQAERLGASTAWVPEFWMYDALTPVAYLAATTDTIGLGTAIAQLGTRTPAMLAMSAMSLHALSGGRFVLGIGASGPQVMEGWHGVRFDRPVRRTRETIEIVRAIAAGERLEHHGEVCELPLPGGEGRALRSMMPPAPIPIYVAALGPENLRLTGALADGWIGNSFLPETAEAFFGPIREGAGAAGRDLADLDLTVAVGLELTDDVDEAGRRHAEGYAFT